MQSSPADMSNETATSNYSVERLTAERLKDVEQLYEAVYGRSASPGYFTTKYNTAYTGLEYVGFVAYNKDRIPVAYYGVIPCFLQNGNERIIAAQSADTMTHPKFRYKGMFVELSNITFDLCRRLGIRAIFGFPNQNSYHGAVHKLGWKLTHTIECFIIPVRSMPIASISAKTRLTKSIYETYRRWMLRSLKEKKNLIPSSVVKEGFIGVSRDSDYEKAKDYYPREVLRIENAAVWCKVSNELVIGDINVVAVDFENTIRKIEKIAAKLGLKQIQFHVSPGTELHALFASRYKSIPSFPALFQQFDSTVDIEKVKFSFADIDIF